jgi:hypothetical protein
MRCLLVLSAVRSLPGRQVYEDESERISIMAGVTDSTEGRIDWRRPTSILRFSLATLRRTIHSDYPTTQPDDFYFQKRNLKALA